MADKMECKKNGCQAIININVGKFVAICPECRSLNCVKCQAVHDGMSCKGYQQKLQGSPDIRTEQDYATATTPTPPAAQEPSPRESTPGPVETSDELLVECKVQNCGGQAFVDKDTALFCCSVCKHYTCLKCMAVHESLTCAQYQSNKEGVPTPVYKSPKQPKGDQVESDDEEDEEQKVDDEAEGRIVNCRYGRCPGYGYVSKTATIAQCELCEHWTCIACNASHESQSCARYKGIEEPPEDEHPEPQVQSSKLPTGARPKERKDVRNGAAKDKNEGLVSKFFGTVGNLLGRTTVDEGEVAQDTLGNNHREANGFAPGAARYGGSQDQYVYKKVQPSCEACSSRQSDHVVEACEHALCRQCILKAVKKSTTRELVGCPVKGKYVERCSGSMPIDEVTQVVSKADMKNITKNSKWQRATCFNKKCRAHCETRKNAQEYVCPWCSFLNCLHCQAIHEGMTCEEHIQKFVADMDHGRLEDPREKQQRLEEQIKLHEQDCVLTTKEFECPICVVEVEPGEGIRLRNCLHEVCKQCLAETARNSPSAEVKCPSVCGDAPCEMPVLDNDIRACLSAEDYQALQERGLREAENSGKEPSFHCKTPDCKGWCVYTREAQLFDCPICEQQNCLGCEAIHKDMNCADYQADLKRRAENDSAAKASIDYMEELLKSGQAMRCPQCHVVIIKKVGCDGIVCISCKTQLCWATKGARWGPKGHGDTSGGCRCGVNGVKCHPTCAYCH